jgi:hypothetical protein
VAWLGFGALLAVAIALGAGLPALQALLDPHSRPALGLAWRTGLPGAVSAYAAAACGASSLLLMVGPNPGRTLRWLSRATVVSLPWLGLALWLVVSPRLALPVFLPKRAGVLVTWTDLWVLAALSVVGILLALPLLRIGMRAARSVPANPSIRALVAIGALAASILSLAAGRGEPGTQTTPAPVAANAQVILIGIDGADWRHLRPRIDRGLLPVLGALAASGATGGLATIRPTLSPLIWTTIATGHAPVRHGIVDFLEPETKTPFTSNSRRVPALWNLLSEAGVPVGVAGWWVTWPAERVRGAIVSSYATPEQGTIKPMLHEGLAGQTHPPELMNALEGRIRPGLSAGRRDMERILSHYHPPPADTKWQERMQIGSWVLSADRIYAEAIAEIVRRHAPSFLAVYFSATDTTAHVFCQSNPWRHEICERVADGAYVAVDQAVGRVLEAASSPDATIIVVSDHGFDHERGHEHGLLHGPPGIAIVAGPGIEAGTRLRDATIYDVVPTVLALYGLPIPADLRGRPWLGLFQEERLSELHLATGPGTVPATPPDPDSLRPIAASSDEAMRSRLRALGYIE